MNLGALAFLAADVHFKLVAVEEAEAFVHVADADSAAVNFGEALGGDAQAVVFDFDEQAAFEVAGAEMDFTAFEARGETVLDGIFDHGLEQHAGDESFESLVVNFLEDLKFVAAETDNFDVEIIVDEFELFAQRDEGFVLAEEAAENVGKLEDDAASHVRIKTDERRDGVERVEKEMGIDLGSERVHPRFQQELLIGFEVHLDARVVPNLDGHGDAHYGRKDDEQIVAPIRRTKIEQPAGRNGVGQFQFSYGQSEAREQRKHCPVCFCMAQESPDPLRNVQEKKRAEMPDVFFFGHEFADHSGDESDERGGGAGEPFVVAKSRKADERAAEQADDAASDKTHEERAFESEIEETVADQAEDDSDGERRSEEKQEHDFLVGVANFCK